MDDDPVFRYATACSMPGCPNPPRYKVAATWSHGPIRELKNYGLTCDDHRDELLTMAQGRRQTLVIADGELLGPVELFDIP